MSESTVINRCILLVSQPSTESLHENMELEEDVKIEESVHKSQSYLLNVVENGQIGRRSSITSRLSNGLLSVNSQIMDLPGTLKWIYIIIPMLCAAFLIGVFVGSVLSTLFKFK
jgi:hypothetical protein